jgi:hypothetical protein
MASNFHELELISDCSVVTPISRFFLQKEVLNKFKGKIIDFYQFRMLHLANSLQNYVEGD